MQQFSFAVNLPVTYIPRRFEKYIAQQEFITKSQILSRIKKESDAETFAEKPLPPAKLNFKDLYDKMPGRTFELQKICQFLESVKVGEKSPLCLLGNTGCGKTSLILQILEHLSEECPEFEGVYLNCMSVWSVKHIYSFMLEKFFQRRSNKPQVLLNQLLCWPKTQESKGIKLLVLDEVDQYFNEKTFIYNILEWVQRSRIKFGFIMISNMINFSANLESRLKSRLKFNSLVFAPYDYEKLIEIIYIKYPQTEEIFDEDSIIYLCKKVATMNSDVRILEKYYERLVRQWKESEIDKISVQQVRKRLSPSQQVIHFLEPYRFLIEILLKTPINSCIGNNLHQQCFAKYSYTLSNLEIIELLKQVQDLDLIELRDNHRSCNLYFYEWGIALKDYIYMIYDD